MQERVDQRLFFFTSPLREPTCYISGWEGRSLRFSFLCLSTTRTINKKHQRISSIKGRMWRFGPRAGETLSFNKRTFIFTHPAPSLCILSKSLSSSNLIDRNELHFNTSGVVSAAFVLVNTDCWNESAPGPDSVLIRCSSGELLTDRRVRDDNNWWLGLQTESSTGGESAFLITLFWDWMPPVGWMERQKNPSTAPIIM